MRVLRLHDEPIHTLGEIVEIVEKLSWDVQPDGTLLRAVRLRVERYPAEVLTALVRSLWSPRYSIRLNERREEFVVISLVNTTPPLA